MKKYSYYKDIKITDTGLIRPNKLDFVYTCMIKNNISNLQELFNMADEGTINYDTTKGYAKYKCPDNQASGTVNLLRYKYLREDLPFVDLLESKIDHGELIKDGKTLKHGVLIYLTKLGLPYEFSESLDMRIYNSCYFGKLIDYLTYYNIEKPYVVYCSLPEYENAIAKLDLIIEWYNSREKDIANLETLKETRIMLQVYYKKLSELKEKQIKLEQEISDTTTKINEVEHQMAQILQRELK